MSFGERSDRQVELFHVVVYLVQLPYPLLVVGQVSERINRAEAQLAPEFVIPRPPRSRARNRAMAPISNIGLPGMLNSRMSDG